MGYVASPACLCGAKEESGAHLITDCVRYRKVRQEIFGKPELELKQIRQEL